MGAAWANIASAVTALIQPGAIQGNVQRGLTLNFFIQIMTDVHPVATFFLYRNNITDNNFK
jgi:hypothetical protein